MVKLLLSDFRTVDKYEREVDKWKKFLTCYSLKVREPLEIDSTP